ncbi:MAG: helix-turn-helix domain-containing protein [Eubacteriales bacterium]
MDGLHIYRIGHENCTADKETTEAVVSYHILHFVFSGQGYFNGQRVTAGQMFLCRYHTFIRYYPDPTDPWEYGFIDGFGSLFDHLLNEMGFTDSVSVLPMHHPEYIRQLILCGMNSIEQEYLCGICYSIMHLQIAENIPQHANAPYQHVQKAIQYIERKSGRVTPSEVAEKLHLSRAYLRNLFMEKQGVSVQKYIQRCRMLNAAKLLAETDFPINAVADAVGYDDPLLFSKMFRRFSGSSPTAYRKQSRVTETQIDSKKAFKNDGS